jgi:hypothetical protein
MPFRIPSSQRQCPIPLRQDSPNEQVRLPPAVSLPFVHLSHIPRASPVRACVRPVLFCETTFAEVKAFAGPDTLVANTGDELPAATT